MRNGEPSHPGSAPARVDPAAPSGLPRGEQGEWSDVERRGMGDGQLESASRRDRSDEIVRVLDAGRRIRRRVAKQRDGQHPIVPAARARRVVAEEQPGKEQEEERCPAEHAEK